MNERILIDAIVRQTVILIAQLSTADGVRSPLSHVADEVFLGLVRQLESQGIGKKIIADMFGLALRSYQQKVQRLGESATQRGVSLWGAIHTLLTQLPSASRSEVIEHFKHDEPQNVRSVLNDLVESGLVLRSGRGVDTRYRVATAEELEELGTGGAADVLETNAALVWVQVYHGSPLRRADLGRLVPLTDATIDAALERLVSDGRVRLENRPDGTYCLTEQCLIPLGQAAGWEAALVDHHRAVLTALAAKVVGGSHVSRASDENGGTTLSFDLWREHPHEVEVRRLLNEVRSQVIPLWEKVEAYNREHPTEPTCKVNFYCGQHVVQEDGET
jgi:DNA-binding HxlR family transcriptional regulator